MEEAKSEPRDARLIARLMLGSAVLGGERLMRALRVLGQTVPDAGMSGRPSWRHAVIGASLAASRLTERGRSRMQPLARGAAQWGVGAWRAFRWLPVGHRAGRWWQAGRSRAAAWAEAGHREEMAARALARAVALASVEVAMAVVADSPDVRQVIEEQSTGMARSVLEDVRGGSQRADALAERIARRLLRWPAPPSGP